MMCPKCDGILFVKGTDYADVDEVVAEQKTVSGYVMPAHLTLSPSTNGVDWSQTAECGDCGKKYTADKLAESKYER